MKFHHEVTYAAAPADVFAMLAAPAFRDKVCQAQNSHDRKVSIEPSGEGMSVVVDQQRPSDDLPGFAKKIVGDQINIVQSEEWSDPSGAVLDVAIPGKPGRLTATIALDGDDSASVEVIDGDLKVQIPLLSGKLESLISRLLHAALDAEEEVGRAWLAGER